MKKTLFLFVTLVSMSASLLCLFLFVSCKQEGESKVEYIPFQESENGLWGMISSDGEVLFTEEFKNPPTYAKEGRFMVKNNQDLWEIFTTESKPQKVGEEFMWD